MILGPMSTQFGSHRPRNATMPRGVGPFICPSIPLSVTQGHMNQAGVFAGAVKRPVRPLPKRSAKRGVFGDGLVDSDVPVPRERRACTAFISASASC